jgi:hypothetical protein
MGIFTLSPEGTVRGFFLAFVFLVQNLLLLPFFLLIFLLVFAAPSILLCFYACEGSLDMKLIIWDFNL